MASIKNIGHLSQAASIARKLADMAETLASKANPLHRADIDLLRQNTLKLYEEILQLAIEGKPDDEHEPIVEKPAAKSSPKFDAEENTSTADMAAIATKAPEKQDDAAAESHRAVTDFPKNEPLTPEQPVQPQVQKTESPHRERKPAAPAMPDLFSETGLPLADKLASQPDNSLAAKLGKSPIADLRKAIGINDKFLFINELFEGNIQQYNHAIDELNSFQSYNGAKTYLIELSVLHGWDNDMPAVQKLHELIDRKFEHA